MYSIRCLCGKIVCQVDNMGYLPRVEEVQPQAADPQGPALVILCRHCRRYLVLRVPTVTAISFQSSSVLARGQQIFTTQT